MTNQEAIRILNEQRNKFMDECIDFSGVNEAYNTAINLLKEQDAVEPLDAYFDLYKSGGLFHCGHCKELIVKNQKYCHNCGRKVKWDA